MGLSEHSPAYWRARAEEARIVAETTKDAQARLSMLSAVRTYERLADLAEEKHTLRGAR
jgi:hypothetical protein